MLIEYLQVEQEQQQQAGIRQCLLELAELSLAPQQLIQHTIHQIR